MISAGCRGVGLARPTEGLDRLCSFFVLVALPQFRLLPATAEYRLSNLPPAAPATRDSSRSPVIDQVTPAAWAAPAAAASRLVPPSSPPGAAGPAGPSQEALPAGPVPKPARLEGPGPAREIRSSRPPAVFIRN